MTSTVVPVSGTKEDRINKYKTYINTNLQSFDYFKELKEVPDIEGLCLGIMARESSLIPFFISNWNVDKIIEGFKKATTSGYIFNKVFNATRADLLAAYQDPLSLSRPQKLFVLEIIVAHGLGQVMGYHFCQDLIVSGGKSTFIKGFGIVPRAGGGSFACSYTSPAGTINNMFAGVNGEENQVRASMIVLADKYKGIKKPGVGTIEAIKTSIKSYLGGPSGDMYGTNPTKYLAQVINYSKPPYGGKGGGSTNVANVTQLADNKTGNAVKISKACALA